MGIHHSGGGCGAGRPIIGGAKQRVKKFIEIIEESERQHEAWMASPEGQEALRKEQEEAEKLAEENKKKDEWEKKAFALRGCPEVGTILSSKPYLIHARQNPYKRGLISVYCLVRVEGEYPEEPKRVLANEGDHGLKIFFGGQSRKWLEEKFYEEFKQLWILIDRQNARIERRREKLNQDYSAENTAAYKEALEYDPVLKLELDLPVRITSMSQTGKSMFGELII